MGKSVVYVVQEQAGKNISQALDFGEVKVLFPEKEQVGFSAGAASNTLFVKLSKFNSNDYLLLMGDPVLIGIACAVASHWNNGHVRMLKWDRQERRYIPVQFNLFREKGESSGPEQESFER